MTEQTTPAAGTDDQPPMTDVPARPADSDAHDRVSGTDDQPPTDTFTTLKAALQRWRDSRRFAPPESFASNTRDVMAAYDAWTAAGQPTGESILPTSDRPPLPADPGDGLYVKFRVERVDGRDQPGGDREQAQYFVLDYAQDPYAPAGVRAYADACEHAEPGLARDLRAAIGDAEDLDDDPVHTAFGLSYANYLVIPRTLLQSMPVEWQRRIVACINELHEAFAHVDQAQAYKVDAAEEIEYSSLTEAQMAQLGVTREERSEGDCWYDADGNEHQGWERALIPVADPVPHYQRGRTRIQPAGDPT